MTAMNSHIVPTIMDRGNAYVSMVSEVMVRKSILFSIEAREHALIMRSMAHKNFYKFCINIDECLEELDNCGDHAICNDLPGTWNCTCEVGYHDFDRDLNGGRVDSCTDINECFDMIGGIPNNVNYLDKEPWIWLNHIR